jgi:hypothetical protein
MKKGNKRNNIISLLGLVMLVGIFTIVLCAQDSSADDVYTRPVKPGVTSTGYYSSGWQYINTSYQFVLYIRKDNREEATYIITVVNPTNKTIKLGISGMFPEEPEELDLMVDGSAEEFRRTHTDDSYSNNVNYLNEYLLNPKSQIVFEIGFTRLVTPNYYNLGLWSINYQYSSPLSIHYDLRDENPADARIDFYGRMNYLGEIRFGYRVQDISCGGCRFDYENDVLTVDNQNWFIVSWEKPRTPVVSSIAYFAMIVFGIMLLFKARKK